MATLAVTTYARAPLTTPAAGGSTTEAASERERVDRIASDSWYARGPNAAAVRYSAEVFARHWHGSSCLELGPAEGLMTENLAGVFSHLVAVEGSAAFCASLAERFPGVRVVHSLFEEFETDERFDTIAMGHVLEHVAEPRELLRRARGWLAPGGTIVAAVPNALSLHRQAAVDMGLLESEHSFNEADLHHGHRRIYDPVSLRADVRAAGLSIRASGGFWLKPVSNDQIEASWTPQMLAAFMRLGERYPDIAAEAYVVAQAE